MFPGEHYGDMFHVEHFVQAGLYVQSRYVYEKNRLSQMGIMKIAQRVWPILELGVETNYSVSPLLNRFSASSCGSAPC